MCNVYDNISPLHSTRSGDKTKNVHINAKPDLAREDCVIFLRARVEMYRYVNFTGLCVLCIRLWVFLLHFVCTCLHFASTYVHTYRAQSSCRFFLASPPVCFSDRGLTETKNKERLPFESVADELDCGVGGVAGDSKEQTRFRTILKQQT